MNPRLIINACAGAGKTFRLTSRFLSLVAAGESPSKIFATTFTNKAAAEIRERLLTRLLKACVDSESALHLSTELKVKPETEQFFLNKLKLILTNQHKILVTTLDAFCNYAARLYPFEISNASSWRFADSNEEKALVKEALLLLFHQASDRDEIIDEIITSQNKAYRSTERTIDTVCNVLETFRDSHPEAWFQQPLEVNEQNIERLINEVENMPIPLISGKAKTPKTHWLNYRDNLLKALRSNNFTNVADKGLLDAVLKGKDSYDRTPIDATTASLMMQIADQITASLTAELRNRTAALAKTISRLDQILIKVKGQHGLLTFSDLKRALASAINSEGLQQLFFRLDSKINHLLLDEFQDTSRDQWEVIKPLLTEILSKADGDTSFLAVGDEKQAIYGWRGGEVGLIGTLRNQAEIAEENISETRRCSKSVTDIVNRIFSGIFHEHTTLNSEQGKASIITTNNTLADSAKLAVELHRKNPALKIGILFRKKTTLLEFQKEIAKEGLPLEPPKDSLEGVLKLLCTLIDHPYDTNAAFYVANSVFAADIGLSGYSDKNHIAEVSSRLRSEIIIKGLPAFLSRLISKHPSAEGWHLLERAYALNDTNLIRCSESFEKLKLNSESSSTVKAMTIHAAKGLEFDAVILPELCSTDGNNNGLSLLTERKAPDCKADFVSIAPYRWQEPYLKKFSPILEKQEKKDLQEENNLLYVAITRARYGLYMFLDNKRDKDRVVSLIKEKIGDTFSSGDENWIVKISSDAENKESKITLPKAIELQSEPLKKRGFVKQTPSKTNDLSKIPLRQFLSQSGKEARSKGILLHKQLQKIEWSNDSALFVSKEMQELFSKEHYLKKWTAVSVFRERRFLIKQGDSIIDGAFDRVVVGYQNGKAIGAEIIDFKSDKNEGEIQTRYQKQMEIYRSAAAKLFNLGKSAVSVRIVTLENGRVLEI